MSDAERVTIKAYNTTDEAKDAERLLLDHGLNKDVVSRKGKKLKVAAEREDEARLILGAGASGMRSSDQTPAGTVVDGVQAVAGKMADATHSAAGTVSDTVQSVTTTVVDQVGGVVDAAGERVAELAVTVREYGADGAGVQRQVARTTAGALDRTAYYLRQGDISIVLDDLRAAIRRSPGRSLLLGLGLGYLARTSFGDATTDGKSTRDANASLDA